MLTQEEQDYLRGVAKGRKPLTSPEANTLATLCLHYTQNPEGHETYGLWTSMIYFRDLSRQEYQGDQRLLELATRITTITEPTALGWDWD